MHDEYTQLKKDLDDVKETFSVTHKELVDLEKWEASGGTTWESTRQKAQLLKSLDATREENKMLEDKKLVMQLDVSRAYDSWWKTYLDEQEENRRLQLAALEKPKKPERQGPRTLLPKPTEESDAPSQQESPA
ncbi:hypothetical protein VHEMI06400 [[Torrubiella] hemipterigena]|uniref:Uncharacterized protein n=1 Tax=[Torrubiella] hemipterigena TaxID=1531966 RepID=A0A0A1TL22_9HYPO|nr:hypothetical protein VHEMI06400 [[Torrubiella] hemipterigena]